MEMPKPRTLICGGGSAKNPLMNRLRATLFDCEVAVAAESDASALGACMIAMTGAGVYQSLPEAISDVVTFAARVSPDPRLAEMLRQRFSIYKDVYGGVKDIFKKFNQLKEIEA
jgi:xylulokinase